MNSWNLHFLGLYKILQAKVLCELCVFHGILWRHKCRLQNLGRENALNETFVDKKQFWAFLNFLTVQFLLVSHLPVVGMRGHNSRRHVGQNTPLTSSNIRIGMPFLWPTFSLTVFWLNAVLHFLSNHCLQALAVVALTSLEDVGIRGMKHEITMGNICSSNNNNKVLY